MKRYALMVALLLLVVAPQARGQGVEVDDAPAVVETPETPETPEIQNRPQEDACDCCQKCNAATSTLKTKEEYAAPEKDGCNDCCTRCAEGMKNLREEPPPEVIQKAPPDVMEKEE